MKRLVNPLILLIALSFAFSGCGPSKATAPHAAIRTEIQDPTPKIHADQEVVLSPNAFGCEFASKFAEAVEHYSKQEYSAWSEITGDKPYCFNSATLPAGIYWTVLQIRGELMQVKQTTVNQYVFDTDLGKHSFWTAVLWASPYIAPPAVSTATSTASSVRSKKR